MFVVIRKKVITTVLAVFALILVAAVLYQKSVSVFNASTIDTIIIDPGHGGNDPGAIGISKTEEKNINLQVALTLKNLAEDLGFNVIMTRETDIALYESGSNNKKRSDLNARKSMTDKVPNAVFVSIHMNKFEQEAVKGAQTFYSDREDSKLLAECIQNEFKEKMDNKRVSMKTPKSIYLLQNTERPTVLVECGFLSNRGEEQQLSTPEYREEIAKCVLNGISNFINKPESIE